MSTTRGINRRSFVAAGLGAAGLVTGQGRAARAQGRDAVKLLLDWLPTGDYAAYFAGIAQGFFREAGIDLTIERGFGGADTVTKIATGVAEFGIADIGSLMAGRVRTQVPVKAIASIYTRPPHSLFVLAASGIRSFKDLEGKKLAGAPGSSVRVFLPLVLARNNVDIAKIEMIQSEPATMGPLLVSGQVNAVMGFLPNLPRFNGMARQQGGAVNALEFADTLQIYGNVLFASEATIAGKADLVRRFAGALVRSLEFTRDNARTAFSAIQAAVPGLNPEGDFAAMEIATKLMFDSEVARRLPTGSLDAAQVKRTWELLAEAQSLPTAATDPEVFVVRGLLPRG
ncbi:MAG: ABC transporter substrate-binding protein [Phreatobacter sp.]|uniref:ABC transporter substrate-binding protein n=1 Tax=Phreatobacter sp. TaxID=1966341 RepID=UPI0027323C40|nr:ABC transporter substrate-binding protein [Phreatobacter sp.]MDP2800289.1 ABC transporter substrate-binding protein [Phreatobacter sp.]